MCTMAHMRIYQYQVNSADSTIVQWHSYAIEHLPRRKKGDGVGLGDCFSVDELLDSFDERCERTISGHKGHLFSYPTLNAFKI